MKKILFILGLLFCFSGVYAVENQSGATKSEKEIIDDLETVILKGKFIKIYNEENKLSVFFVKDKISEVGFNYDEDSGNMIGINITVIGRTGFIIYWLSDIKKMYYKNDEQSLYLYIVSTDYEEEEKSSGVVFW